MTDLRGPNVFLVGAGPGDPGLITRRGLELLRSCEVVLYDRLIDPHLLDEAPADAKQVFVGKSPGRSSLPQAKIDQLVIKHAREGKRVVRLKGGDPFVFGRGADEAQALAAAGIAFEVVPGVSSSIAVPAYAGIPLTHSGVSSSFAVLTAHESSERPESDARWEALAKGAGTLVLMMGVSSLSDTATRLIDAGRDPDEPAAVIERGTTGEQRTIVGPVRKIADLATEANIQPPAITVVGPVVGLRDAVEWFELRPLFGKRVVVTRPSDQSLDLKARLEEQGASVVLAPTISIGDPESWEELDRALVELEAGLYNWVIFSSRNAVEKVMNRLWEKRRDARVFRAALIAAVGPVTQAALKEWGLRSNATPSSYTARDLIDTLGGGEGKVLLPRAAGAPDQINTALSAIGWEVDEVDAYRTTSDSLMDSPNPDVADGYFDAVTFASGSAARGFVDIYGPPDKLGLGTGVESDKIVACIGPSTAEVAEELGFDVDVVAEEHTSEGLVTTLVTHFS